LNAIGNKHKPIGLTLKRIFDNTDKKIVDILANVDVSRSFVERLFKGKESQFDMVLAISKFLDFDIRTLIEQYCEEIEMPKNFLYVLEFCDRSNQLDLVELLIGRSESKTLPELKELRLLYQISLQRKRDGRKENLERMLLAVKEIESTSPISQTYQKFVEIQLYYELKEYAIVRRKLNEIHIERIEDTFFYESFRWRLNQVEQSIALRFHANFKRSRELAFELLEMSDSNYFHAFAYGNLGLSHAFTNNKELALRYLNKSQQLYSKTGMSNSVWDETIEFFKVLWGHTIELEDIKSSKNLALRLIKIGKNYQSLKIIDKIEEIDGETPMGLYLKGLALDDESYHWRSLELYIRERGDKLFALLPKSELIRLNQNQYGVNALCNILSKQ